MDLHAPASPSWDRNGNAYHQPVHDIFDSSSLILSDSPAFQPSYHDPFTTMENKAQPSSEISMGNNETELHSAPSIRGAQMDARPTRRARSDRLDWDACKDTIKELYIDQNKSLSETMAVMRKEYSFNASQKLYKIKFKQWNWRKNLSTAAAQKMAEIAKRRKREEGKNTVFTFGGKVWDPNRVESTLVRSKKPTANVDLTGRSPPTNRIHRSVHFNLPGRELRDTQAARRVSSHHNGRGPGSL
ncbi:MAG: hypothetical protein LQ352_003291 [Teloschistes flavicans]|nr:MAG: hypothetical protein LQ352_003291 [Teloschistes flavicans]